MENPGICILRVYGKQPPVELRRILSVCITRQLVTEYLIVTSYLPFFVLYVGLVIIDIYITCLLYTSDAADE